MILALIFLMCDVSVEQTMLHKVSNGDGTPVVIDNRCKCGTWNVMVRGCVRGSRSVCRFGSDFPFNIFLSNFFSFYSFLYFLKRLLFF